MRIVRIFIVKVEFKLAVYACNLRLWFGLAVLFARILMFYLWGSLK